MADRRRRLKPGVRGAGRAGWAGGELLGTESDALLFESETLAGELLLFGAVRKVQELGGGIDLRAGAGERVPGEGLGVSDGDGVELAGGEGGEDGGAFVVIFVALGEDVALIVHGHGAFAGVQAEGLVEVGNDGGVGAVFVFEPDAEEFALFGI